LPPPEGAQETGTHPSPVAVVVLLSPMVIPPPPELLLDPGEPPLLLLLAPLLELVAVLPSGPPAGSKPDRGGVAQFAVTTATTAPRATDVSHRTAEL
jgi:hypothetical protein